MSRMSEVVVGMVVLDSTGMRVGEVDEVKFGDAEAVTEQGQQAASG